jgi:hypothetical protein
MRQAGRRDPRHGHGLRIISAIAAEHGGRFEIRRSTTGTTAILELPLAPTPLATAKRGIAAAGSEVTVGVLNGSVGASPERVAAHR